MTWSNALSLSADLIFVSTALLILGVGAGYGYEFVVRVWRRWRCRQELAQLKGVPLTEIQRVLRRRQLDGAATAQDKHARRIH